MTTLQAQSWRARARGGLLQPICVRWQMQVSAPPRGSKVSARPAQRVLAQRARADQQCCRCDRMVGVARRSVAQRGCAPAPAPCPCTWPCSCPCPCPCPWPCPTPRPDPALCPALCPATAPAMTGARVRLRAPACYPYPRCLTVRSSCSGSLVRLTRAKRTGARAAGHAGLVATGQQSLLAAPRVLRQVRHQPPAPPGVRRRLRGAHRLRAPPRAPRRQPGHRHRARIVSCGWWW